MNHNLSVSQSVQVKATDLKVWEVLTNPNIIKEYLYGTETLTDWKVGSEIIFQGEYEGHKYRDHGKVTENIYLEKISYSYWSGFTGLDDKPENYSTVEYHIKKLDEQTTLFTWTQKGYATQDGYEHSKNGMEAFLEQVKNIMER
jgi:uncharacterized protein YndB with AHSA1/START domain